jgi:hypothetical protein
MRFQGYRVGLVISFMHESYFNSRAVSQTIHQIMEESFIEEEPRKSKRFNTKDDANFVLYFLLL